LDKIGEVTVLAVPSTEGQQAYFLNVGIEKYFLPGATREN
jgi:hypothetical protein